MANPINGRGNNWRHAEVDQLINIWADSSILAVFNSKGKNTKAYIKVAEKMEEAGYNRSQTQIQIKIKNLRNSYYKAKREAIKNGVSRESLLFICPYYDRIDEIMGKTTTAFFNKSSTIMKLEEEINESQMVRSLEEIESGEDVQLKRIKITHPEIHESIKTHSDKEKRVGHQVVGKMPTSTSSRPTTKAQPTKSVVTGLVNRRWRVKNNYVDRLEKLFNDERKEMRKWQQKMWSQQLAMEEERHRRDEERQRREEEIFKHRMKVDEEVSRGMMQMMGQMLNIMSNMGSAISSQTGGYHQISTVEESNANCIDTVENKKKGQREKKKL